MNRHPKCKFNRQTGKPLRNNLTLEERQALKQLQYNKSIVIKKTDKGGAIVIMNKSDYIAEANHQLNDINYC